jgi:type I restriction enzyme, S subunit
MMRQRDWPTVKFGDVVRQVKDRVDPTSSGLTRYVAGEHMDTDDLRIRRWGEINGDYFGPAFHMRFRPGQVLYGSRRTYLRKVAVADFEGICANTTFVLEPQEPQLLSAEFLPWIMQTESFHEHSIKQSKGSVNPYVNFSDLAWYEFPLPPLQEQRRRVTLLLGLTELLESLLVAREHLDTVRRSTELAVFGWSLASLQNLGDLIEQGTLEFQTGPFGTVLKAESYKSEGYPVVNPSDMVEGRLVFDQCRRVGSVDWKRLGLYQLRAHDLLIGRKGDMKNLVYIEPEYNGCVMGSDCIRFRVIAPTLSSRYLFYYLRADTTRHWLQSQAYGTIMPGLNERLLARLRILVPPASEQEATVLRFQAIDASMRSLRARLAEGQEARRSLLSAVARGTD